MEVGVEMKTPLEYLCLCYGGTFYPVALVNGYRVFNNGAEWLSEAAFSRWLKTEEERK